MGTLISKKAQLVLLALGLTVAACGGDDGEAAPTGGPNLGGDGGVIVPDAGTTTSDGGVANCFNGQPSESLQFLNKCADGCQPFNNATRLPASYKAGQPLPQLP